MSDHDRPESAGRTAFVELEAVVRNVTEQLSGYRRRALSAEAQVRDLEIVSARASADAESARAAQTRIEELERALSSAEQATGEATAAAARATRESEAAAEALAAQVRQRNAQGPTSEEVLAENAALRERLADASDRTRQIAERVHFVRQQLGTGGEK